MKAERFALASPKSILVGKFLHLSELLGGHTGALFNSFGRLNRGPELGRGRCVNPKFHDQGVKLRFARGRHQWVIPEGQQGYEGRVVGQELLEIRQVFGLGHER